MRRNAKKSQHNAQRNDDARGETRGVPAHATRIWLWLTGPIAFLVAIAAGVGFFIEDLYRDAPVNAAQAVGQDLITLVVALPRPRDQRDPRPPRIQAGASRLVGGSWLPGLHLPDVCARDSSSTLCFWSTWRCSDVRCTPLIGGLATTDFAGIKARFSRGTPVKAVSIFLAVVAVLFYFMWLSEDIPALLAGEVPQGVIEGEAPTDVVHVLDMAWILPAMVLTAIWLWRGRALGYALAGTLLSFLSLLVLGYHVHGCVRRYSTE